jgi:cyclopropane-fatty-acyl-phospholipid synthase
MPKNMKPFYEDVQAHYDLSDDFFALFLDPTRTYSCAYFEKDSMSLEEAQLAKIDLSLGKCHLQPGQTLLDIGCGWGATALRAATKHDVKVIGLTLSKNQHAHATKLAQQLGLADKVEFQLRGWEEFTEPKVDRIVSIGAFEHFRLERHAEFFQKCNQLLNPGGRMMLHTIVFNPLEVQKQLNVVITEEDVAFGKFIGREIFPGGQLCIPEKITKFAGDAGFEVENIQSLRLHYARTLDAWARALEDRQKEAIEMTNQVVYDRYMKYLTGCARMFRKGNIDVMQFKLSCKS